MLMGTPANQNRYIHEQGQFFYSKMDLELNILERLVGLGYDVIYKAHPDRLKELGALFNLNKVKLISEPFEKVWQSADAYIFTDTASTTFGFALATKKHMFLFNNSFDERDYHMNKLLEKRVNMIGCKLKNTNRFSFSNEEFISVLKNPIQELNSELFNYIFN